jgi:hypothetical protein
MSIIEVCPLDGFILTTAHNLAMAGFEDAVQVSSAQMAGIVTCNHSDFANAPIAILSPSAVLAQLPSSSS